MGGSSASSFGAGGAGGVGGDHLVARGEGERRLEAVARAGEVAEPLQALPEESAGQDVVGGTLEDDLELGPRGGDVAGVQQGSTERHARGGIGRVLLQAL